MRILTYRATEQDAGKRVETALMGRLQVSRGLLSRLKRREDGICVNGQRVYSTYVLKAGDIVSADVGDREPPRHLEPVPMVLSIAYEDEDLLVVDKPANLPVHPTKDPAKPSLEQGLLAYLSAGDYPHFVSRLDKGTTGLMLVAKSGYMHELMQRRLHTDAFCRAYLAVAAGIVAPQTPTAQTSSRKSGASSIFQYEQSWTKQRHLDPSVSAAHSPMQRPAAQSGWSALILKR